MAGESANDDTIRAKAAALLSHRDAGWSAEEAAEFALWRAADPRHETAVRRLEATQRLLTELHVAPSAAALLEEVETAYGPKRRVVHIGPWLKACAAIALAACVVFAAWILRPQSPAPLTFATTTDQHRTVDLADGSTLLMKGGSKIEIDYRSTERRINLRHGDVHFAVAKDTTRPFIVAAGTVRVRAVGTAFNVRTDAAEIEIVVSEGKVEVSRTDAANLSSPPAAEPIFLVAGQSTKIGSAMNFAPSGVSAGAPQPSGASAASAAARLDFANTPLSEAIARFNLHSRVQLELGDSELGARPIGGVFDANNAEAFVNVLLLTGEIRAERVSDNRIVLRKAR